MAQITALSPSQPIHYAAQPKDTRLRSPSPNISISISSSISSSNSNSNSNSSTINNNTSDLNYSTTPRQRQRQSLSPRISSSRQRRGSSVSSSTKENEPVNNQQPGHNNQAMEYANHKYESGAVGESSTGRITRSKMNGNAGPGIMSGGINGSPVEEKESNPFVGLNGETTTSELRQRTPNSAPLPKTPSTPNRSSSNSKRTPVTSPSPYNGVPTLPTIPADEDFDSTATADASRPTSPSTLSRAPPPAPSAAIAAAGVVGPRPVTRPRRSSSIKRKPSPGVTPQKAVDWEIPRKSLHSSIGECAVSAV
jgi:hypothetical protein